jgi:hypothetical protein
MPRFFRLIAASVALVALVAACSGTANGPGVATLDDPGASGSHGSSPSPAASAMTPQDAALAYARCMRENGVDMPDPKVTTAGDGGIKIDQGGGAPVSKEKLTAADKVCHPLMAAAGPGGPGGHLSAEELDKLLQFAKCMREHGVDMPDPNADGGFVTQISGNGDGSGTAGTGAMSPDDPDFQAAQTACASLLPGKMGKPGLQTSDGKSSGPVNGATGGAASTSAPQ